MIERRGFMAGILALGMAPAIVRAGSIMPVKVVDEWGAHLNTAFQMPGIIYGAYERTIPVKMADILALGLKPGSHPNRWGEMIRPLLVAAGCPESETFIGNPRLQMIPRARQDRRKYAWFNLTTPKPSERAT